MRTKQNLPVEDLFKLLDETSGESLGAKESAGAEKVRKALENEVFRHCYSKGHSESQIRDVASKAVTDSVIYYLAKRKSGKPSRLKNLKTDSDRFNLLLWKAKREATTMFRRKRDTKIKHGFLDAPRMEDDEGTTNLDQYQKPGQNQDPVTSQLRLGELADTLSQLPQDDQEFMEKLVSAQLDGGYKRPPYKIVAAELGVKPHKVEYRWKKLKARIAELTRENRET
ncbi:hypothetical protein SAMN04487881_0012 [Marinobacter sp. es.048]|nr:hypothetical protein SAMN04487881_0012 [Marinobacter sp. es.048]